MEDLILVVIGGLGEHGFLKKYFLLDKNIMDGEVEDFITAITNAEGNQEIIDGVLDEWNANEFENIIKIYGNHKEYATVKEGGKIK